MNSIPLTTHLVSLGRSWEVVLGGGMRGWVEIGGGGMRSWVEIGGGYRILGRREVSPSSQIYRRPGGGRRKIPRSLGSKFKWGIWSHLN